MKETRREQRRPSGGGRAVTAVGVLFCVLFGGMLLCNLTIIVKGILFPHRPPSVLGVTPMVVLSGSMSGEAEGHIEVGDLILVGETRPEELEVGDVITYTSGGSTVTHRITAIALQEDGSRLFTTKGDANDGEDTQPVTEEQLVGVCWGRIPRAGEVALFFQTPLGMLLFVALPLAAFVAYDILRRQRDAGREREKVREMEAELSRLRSLAGEGEPREGPGEEPPDDHPRNPRGEGGHGPADTAG